MKAAWKDVGKAQRDVPAHVAHEYCHPNRSFDPRPTFNDETLPRSLTFENWQTDEDERWFPLAVSTSSGLGVDFALSRVDRPAAAAADVYGSGRARVDLAAVSHLDEVRSADLIQLRKDLNVAEPEQCLGMSY